MNTNRSTTLGTRKAIKKFGPRKGAAVYNRLKRGNRQRALWRAAAAPAKKVADAIRKLSVAAAMPTITEDLKDVFAKCRHGPVYNTESWWMFYDEPHGNPGVSVNDLTTLAQQYAYLHPNK